MDADVIESLFTMLMHTQESREGKRVEEEDGSVYIELQNHEGKFNLIKMKLFSWVFFFVCSMLLNR